MPKPDAPKMKAAILYGLHDLRLVDVPTPNIQPNSALLKVAACGVCPTDLKKYNTIYGGTLSLPQNLGHEYLGTITEIGPEVRGLEIGMRVVGFGFGGYAEYAILDLNGQPSIHDPTPITVPTEIDDSAGTFIEPVACCVHAILDQVQLLKDQTLLIVGAGTMGLMLLSVAKSVGSRVIVSEPHPDRRAKALSLGADAVIDPNVEKLSSAIRNVNNAELADATILSIGNPGSVQECLEATRPCGCVQLFGRFPMGSRVSIDPILIYRYEIRIVGSYIMGGLPEYSNARECHLKALELIKSKQIPIEALISGTYPLTEIHQAFSAAASMENYKIVITP